MAVCNGKQYIDRINGLKTNIWIDGKPIHGIISEHLAFKGVISSQARLYDLQHNNELKDLMTFKSPVTGDLVGTSFLEPKTKDDLEKRRLMIQEWAKETAGMMGRTPDYMNTVLMVLNAASTLFSFQDQKCAENFRAYFEYVRENDLSLTHVFVKPQTNRAQNNNNNNNNEEGIISARMIDKTADGIIIKGARILATQAGMTDEILVYPVGSHIVDESFAYAFAIPCNTPGLKFLCREAYIKGDSNYNNPLGTRFEEMDAIVVFDNVLVPWDRVFLHGNIIANSFLYDQSSFIEHVGHQIVSKNIIKTEFMLGVIQLIIDTINIGKFQHVQEKLSEVVIALETLKGFVCSAEMGAKVDQWGTMTPDPNPILAAINYYPRIYPRFSEIIQLLGASGLIALPSENDFKSPIKSELDHYLQSFDRNGQERVKLFRLAWDIGMSSFGSRQTLYERFFFGDPVRLAETLYNQYDRTHAIHLAQSFLSE
ncbi:4-hydroxyphenylacetate 3-monooxygenase, oxygenase component [Bacillus sp. Marseille-P3661]|uniref:4-hydroxyphenylacetate 3-monooxygenase, oxygenase component n=1 Tax=Bacillus sp. Marseille-P3661 TaxID=1936234 RepID=UPI000C83F187|nr:4-hydroxyphenylacetate 3-monooxygenase, oxygenase component [Bacillus sp. Marseille-P3661]